MHGVSENNAVGLVFVTDTLEIRHALRMNEQERVEVLFPDQ